MGDEFGLIQGNKGLIRAVRSMTGPKVLNFLPMRLGGLDRPLPEPLPIKQELFVFGHMVETINKLIRTQRKLMQDLGRTDR